MSSPNPTPPLECLVYTYLENLVGVIPMAGAATLVVTNPNNVQYGNTVVRSGTSYAPCDYYGYASLNIVESTTLSFRYFFQIQYVDDNFLQQVSTLGWAQVPNTSSVDLATLTFYPTADSLFTEV
jgi:hypothetical protein